MEELIPFIQDLAIMLCIASMVVLLCQKIRQPVVLGYIIAGIIIGPFTPPYALVTDTTQIQTLSELGVIFLMFAIGLDFSFHKLKEVGFAVLFTGIVKVLITAFFGVYLGKLLHLRPYETLFFGAALSVSSTTIIIKAIEEMGLRTKRFTDIVLGVLIIEDLLAVLMLTSLSTVIVTEHFFSWGMLLATVKLIATIGSWFIIGYFLMPILFRKISSYVSSESLTIVSIALCLFMAVLAAYLHYSVALGAFIMGSILAETPFATRIQELTMPLRDLFAAVFFIAVGMMIDLQGIWQHGWLILGLSLLAAFVIILVTSLSTFLAGQSLSTAIRTGFSMAPIGEFSFIIMSVGITLGVVSKEAYQLVVGVAAVTTLFAPYFMRFAEWVVRQLEQRLSVQSKYLLDRYSAWVYRTISTYRRYQGYSSFFMRLVLHGTVVALIFYAMNRFVYPYLVTLLHERALVAAICWSGASILGAPFFYGMLLSYRILPPNRKNPALFLSIIVGSFEVIFLSLVYFHSRYIPLILIAIMLILFISSYRNLERIYTWLDHYFSQLLPQKRSQPRPYENLAPWNTHIVKMKVTNDDPQGIVGQTLGGLHVRQRYGVNLVAIQRGVKVILAPRGDEFLALGDQVLVLGDDAQLEGFRQAIETTKPPIATENILKNFALRTILLDATSPLVGKTIREAKIREHFAGLVVGLERQGFRYANPDTLTVLKANDLVLIVGQSDVLTTQNENGDAN